MKTAIMFLVLSCGISACIIGLTGCSHGKLMKCTSPIPSDVYHCEDQIQGPYRMCDKPQDDFSCVAPE